MKSLVIAAAMGMAVSFGCLAAAPAGAPAGSTALCKDGSYFSGAEKKGACSGHKGVKEWWGPETAAGADKAQQKPAEGKAAPAKPAATKAAESEAAAAAASTPKAAPPKPAPLAAPGGGAGKVWVNSSSKVYHCPGDRWYGKTKEGEYMSEADAKAKGFKPDRGKVCQ